MPDQDIALPETSFHAKDQDTSHLKSVDVQLGLNAIKSASHERRGSQQTSKKLDLVEEVDQDTGEIITYRNTKNGRKIYRTTQENRADRYALKSVVNRIFPNSRTAKCCRMKIPHKAVEIHNATKFNKAFYSGITRCGSIWWCPICAAKISERRRVELEAGITTAKTMGWQVFLMTCTIPHGIGDELEDTINRMKKAWGSMMNNRAGKELKKRLGIKGIIRAFEVTDSDSGFNPHFHALIFAKPASTIQSFQAGFLPLWQNYCVKAGLGRPSDEHGLHVEDGSCAAGYTSKWGLVDEITKSHTKSAKSEKGMSPWDLLRDALNNNSERSRKRFYIYATAFKGERQLHWSRGLKTMLGITSTTDKELVNMEKEKASLIAEITDDQWRAVMAARSEFALLNMAENRSHEIPGFLEVLEADYKAMENKRA